MPGGMANAPFLPQVIDLKGNELGGSSGVVMPVPDFVLDDTLWIAAIAPANS